jgi:tetratricopeptide (TPR) repeat protein
VPTVSKAASLAIARVLAHCGGSPVEAVAYLAAAITDQPADPEPYETVTELRREWPMEVAAAVATPTGPGQLAVGSYLHFLAGDSDQAARWLGSATGYRPDIAWAGAPWFASEQFLATVTVHGVADAAVAITDYGRDLDNDAVRRNLLPWLRVIDVVCDRDRVPAQMARVAILLRFCGHTEESLALCDRADLVERVMLTEVVRAGTWAYLGDRQKQAAALRRALQLDPANWSLHLDLADLAAQRGDFSTAADLVRQGVQYEPEDVTLRAAGAAYRFLAGGCLADLDLLLELAPAVPHEGYRNGLIEHALGVENLPADRTARARDLLAGQDL